MTNLATTFDLTAPDGGEHHWVRTLRSFAIPFFCYAIGGRRTYVSPAAARLLSADPAGFIIAHQADRLAAGELEEHRGRLRLTDFELACQTSTPSERISLAVHLARPAEIGGIAAVVVFGPAPTAASGRHVDDRLTRREAEVADLIAAGLSTKQIAGRLDISVHTARHHTERVFARLGVTSRAAVAALIASRR